MNHRSLLLIAALASCSADEPESARPQAPARAAPVETAGGALPSSSPGQAPAVAPAQPCPADMLGVGSFCVDRYEAHLRRVSADGPGEVHPHHQRPEEGVRYMAVSEAGAWPQSYISRDEAEAACGEAGKRLCSRSEWMLACRGTAATAAPGESTRPCNHGKAHLLTLLGRGWDYEEDFNDPELVKTPGFLSETGEHDACLSDVGARDMVGNVHEWVSDRVTSSFLRAFEAEGVRRQFQYVAVGNAVFMGGFFSTRGELGAGCAFTTVAHDAAYHDYSTGFRCCRDARSSDP